MLTEPPNVVAQGISVERVTRALRRRARLASTPLLRRRVAKQVRDLANRGISLVSNNCVAGNLYELAGIRKETPTAGLWFSDRAFAEFLNDLAAGNLDRWGDIRADQLRYNEDRKSWEWSFGEAGEIVFLHYPSPEVAVDKWQKRLKRIHGRELIVFGWPQGGLTAEMLEEPSRLHPNFLLIGENGPDPWDELGFHPSFLTKFSQFAASILNAPT